MSVNRPRRTYLKKAIPESKVSSYYADGLFTILQTITLIFYNVPLTWQPLCATSYLWIRSVHLLRYVIANWLTRFNGWQVTYPPAKVESVLELLEQHITENIVKVCASAVVLPFYILSYLDWGWLLSSGRRDPSRICYFEPIVFFLLWGSWEATGLSKLFWWSSKCASPCYPCIELWLTCRLTQLLMRHTDDYLLITADLAKAKQFLRVMNKG